jgi:uncharacterized Zn finger protein
MLCPKCKKSLEQAVKVINYKGISTLINILKCNKCGHTFTALDQAEKARVCLNPSFFERIKSLFSFNNKITEAILDGKVL